MQKEENKIWEGVAFQVRQVCAAAALKHVEVWAGGMEGGICGQGVQWYRRILGQPGVRCSLRGD